MMTERVIGLIGAGAIGVAVLRACAEGGIERRRVVVFVRHRRPELDEQIRRIGGALVSGFEEFLGERPDVVLEAAGHDAVRGYAVGVAQAGIDLVLMSVGALASADLQTSLEAAARAGGASVSIPSGAVGGLDVLTSARAAGDLDCVVHTIRKKPNTFRNVPYVAERSLLPAVATEPLVLYRGIAREAARHFPQNANVAAAVSLAGIGFDRTEVEVVADPGTGQTVHEIRARGGFGSFTLRFENAVDPANPRTTRLAGLSAVAALQRQSCTLRLI